MPSSEHSSSATEVMKRLVARRQASLHQPHTPMTDELSSCPTTPLYDKVRRETPSHKAGLRSQHDATATAAVSSTSAKPSATPRAVTTSSAPKGISAKSTTPKGTLSKSISSKGSSTKSEEPQEGIWWMRFLQWLRRLLDFRDDKEGDVATIESLKGDVEFRGTKLWILICAILVASIGLNVNSTAVIIGAMLISPLMGPIIGFGLGFGIADLDLVRKSLRNLALTTLFSILTATIYFLLTPLDQPGSELLGRTQPSLYDVLIAFVGGAAGLIAGSSKSKGQVLPGVAIATALMPPLCTAGFGLATGNWGFFFGAIYLYLINSVFIAFATFVMVRIMRFPIKPVASGDIRKKSYRWITVIAVCTLIPSIYLSVRLVRESYQEERTKQFIADHFAPPEHQVIRHTLIRTEGKEPTLIDVVLIGKPLSPHSIDSLAALLPSYGLSNFQLQIHQRIDSETPTDYEQLGGVLLRDLYERSEQTAAEQRAEIDSLRRMLLRYDYYSTLTEDVSKEAQALFTHISKVRLMPSMEFIQGQDSVLHILVTTPSRQISTTERTKLEEWLQMRTKADSLQLIIEN